jgi:para-nitrobenzyl esterase
MKRTFTCIILAIVFMFTNSVVSFSANEVPIGIPGTAIFLGPLEAVKIIGDQVNALPSSSFKNEKLMDKQKKDLLKIIRNVNKKIKDSNFDHASKIMDRDMRSSVLKWIVEAECSKIIENITIAITSITNASQSTVKTDSGKVAGLDAYFDSWAWIGIPYAKPPVGKLRWKAPQDPESWCRTRLSDFNFSPCVQPAVNGVGLPLNQVKGSEDCLYLNVYGPKSAKNKPVYFFIHGGGNYMGAAGDCPWMSMLSGPTDKVVVVAQYRLGAFGYFKHPSLNSRGTPYEKSGNFGLLDITKALEWVQENISAFGGDPNNVTIAGESAGGYNVLNLMTSPAAKGLFHKAIAQSPAGRNITSSEGIEYANNVIDKMLVADGTCPDMEKAAAYRSVLSNRQIEAYLRSKTSEELVRGIMNPDGTVDDISPIIDGAVLTGTLDDVFESGKYNKVPVILGTNKNEIKPWLPSMLGDVKTSSGYPWVCVYGVLGLGGPSIGFDEFMPQNSDREIYETVSKYPTMYWKASMVDSLARNMKAHQNNVYTYVFEWGTEGSAPSPFDFLIGAGHGFDLPFFFGWPWDIWGGVSNNPGNEAGRVDLQKSMMTYAAVFAATGNPNWEGSGLPEWKEWSNEADGPKSIIFDADLSKAKISMVNEELTKEDVAAQIKALPLYEQQLISRITNKAKFLQIP